MTHRHPKGAPTGGRFAPDTRSRTEITLAGGPDERAQAEQRYLGLVDAYTGRLRQAGDANDGLPVSRRMALQNDLQAAWRQMDEAAAALGITSPYRQPVDSEELAEARAVATQLRAAVDAGDRFGAWAALHAVTSGPAAMSEEAFDRWWDKVRAADEAAAALEAEPAAIEDWVDAGDARLRLVEVDRYTDDDGYDFEQLRSDLAVEWAARRGELLQEALDEQWSARNRA